MQYSWLVIRSEPNRETVGTAGLVGHGIQAYLPQIKAKERHGRGQIRAALRPMFTGYLFAYSCPADPLWARLYNLPGLRGPLRLGDALAVISEVELQAVRDKEAELINFKAPAGHKFKAGDTVRLIDGSPFAGQLVGIEALDESGRITVLMSLFSRRVRTVVKSDQVERV